MNTASHPLSLGQRATARAFLVGNRIETSGLERSDVLSTLPLSFRAGANGPFPGGAGDSDERFGNAISGEREYADTVL